MVCDTQGQLLHELTNAMWQQVQWLIPHSDDYYMGRHAAAQLLHGLMNVMVNYQYTVATPVFLRLPPY